MTLLDVAPDKTDLDESDGQRHFFRKEDMDRQLFEGVPITALCGYVREGLVNPASDAPVCKKCQWIYENGLKG